MTPHAKVYFKYFDISQDEVVLCEICGKKAVDIHHINGRGKNKDVINNLMSLCRDCHRKAHEKLHPDVVQAIHNNYLNGQTNY